MAVIKETKIMWNGNERMLKPGSVVFSPTEFANNWRISRSAIFKWLKYLERTKRIVHESCTRGSIVTICNWGEKQKTKKGACTRREHDETLIKELKNKEVLLRDPVSQTATLSVVKTPCVDSNSYKQDVQIKFAEELRILYEWISKLCDLDTVDRINPSARSVANDMFILFEGDLDNLGRWLQNLESANSLKKIRQPAHRLRYVIGAMRKEVKEGKYAAGI